MRTDEHQRLWRSISAAGLVLASFEPAARAQAPRAAVEGTIAAGAPVAALVEARTTGVEPPATAEDKADLEGWLYRYRPVANLIELGAFLGPLFISDGNSFRSTPLYNPSGPPVVRPFSTFKRPALEVGVRGGYYPLTFLGAELEAVLAAAENDRDRAASIVAARAQAVVQLPYWSIVPFLAGGVGYWHVFNEVSGDDSDPAFHYGIGAKANVSPKVAVRLDLRDSITNQRGEAAYPHNIEALAGVGLVFGRSAREALDSDNDGFVDERDACPVEPGTLPDGCPARDRDHDGVVDADDHCVSEPGVAPGGCPIRDADRDGVVDDLDLCLTVVGVAPTGCPDSDLDGILDRDDKCQAVPGVVPDGCPEDPDADRIVGAADRCAEQPETRNGFEDADGCPDELPAAVKNFMGVIAGIEFDRNKADIRPSSEFALGKAATILKQYPDLRVEIIGHTDNRGSRELNLDLSLRRAQAVKESIALRGVDPDRLEARGAGPDEPLTENYTPAGRQKNRRIEFRVIERALERTEPRTP